MNVEGLNWKNMNQTSQKKKFFRLHLNILN